MVDITAITSSLLSSLVLLIENSRKRLELRKLIAHLAESSAVSSGDFLYIDFFIYKQMGQKGARVAEEEKRTRTESVSFRIEHSTLDDLRKESKQKTESLNVLMNQIFRFYIDSHKPFILSGNTYFSKAFVSRTVGILSDEQIECTKKILYRFEQRTRSENAYIFSKRATMAAGWWFYDIFFKPDFVQKIFQLALPHGFPSHNKKAAATKIVDMFQNQVKLNGSDARIKMYGDIPYATPWWS
jgi:hypothetical protein